MYLCLLHRVGGGGGWFLSVRVLHCWRTTLGPSVCYVRAKPPWPHSRTSCVLCKSKNLHGPSDSRTSCMLHKSLASMSPMTLGPRVCRREPNFCISNDSRTSHMLGKSQASMSPVLMFAFGVCCSLQLETFPKPCGRFGLKLPSWLAGDGVEGC